MALGGAGRCREQEEEEALHPRSREDLGLAGRYAGMSCGVRQGSGVTLRRRREACAVIYVEDRMVCGAVDRSDELGTVCFLLQLSGRTQDRQLGCVVTCEAAIVCGSALWGTAVN